jgi:hypothetical protein
MWLRLRGQGHEVAERTHQAIDDLTPVAAEELHYRYRAALDQAG